MFRLWNESRLDCEWALTQLWMTMAELVGELRLAYWRVMSRLWTSHVSIMNQSNCGSRIGGKVKTCLWKSLAYGWMRQVSCIWMSHVYEGWWQNWRESPVSLMSEAYTSLMDESRLTYEWVVFRLWMSHVSPMNQSGLTHEWVMPHLWLTHTQQ